MQILPLKFIHDDDKKEVGEDLFNLAKLQHLGLPVVESIVVLPPVDQINKLLQKYSHHSSYLKNYLGNLKNEVLNLKAPEALNDVYTIFSSMNEKKRFNLNIDKLWENLLEKWSYELISKIEREEKNLMFTPQQVVFSSSFLALGTAFFDEDREHVAIQVDSGTIDFKKSEEIENLVHKANKKLVLPQVFYWVIEDGEVKIIKLTPFTQPLPQKDITTVTVPQLPIQKNLPKTATKLLLDYSGQALSSLNADAVLFRMENPDIEKLATLIDRILKFKDLPIIFFPNFANSLGQNLEYAKSFIFFKNKKKLDCQIVLPVTFSVSEYLDLKRQFASLGIYSKGGLKIWKQLLTIADFINTDEYLDAGFDGAIIDLDKVVNIVTGVDASLFLSEPRIDWVNSTLKFFKDSGLKKIIKNNKQVLIFGTCCRNEELLNYFIKSGVWGIALTENLVGPLREHVAYLEKNTFKTKRIN